MLDPIYKDVGTGRGHHDVQRPSFAAFCVPCVSCTRASLPRSDPGGGGDRRGQGGLRFGWRNITVKV